MKKTRRIVFLLLLLLVAVTAFARVGGGDSYGGGSSSSGGGSSDGGGGGELVWLVVRFLFWLTIEHPAIGIPVDIAVITFVMMWLRKKERNTVLRFGTDRIASPVPVTPSVKLDALRRYDPNFSDVVFHDFCYSLYARAHQARGSGQLARYAPYLSAAARQSLQSRNAAGLREVNGIVIGAFRVTKVRGLEAGTVFAEVSYEANYTDVFPNGAKSWYVRETWTLERQRDILSPPPEKAKADHCPRCGAALRTRTDGSCEFCGAKIDSGAFQWYVRSISLVERQERGPVLTGGGVEPGTDLPTVYQAHLPQVLTAFRNAHRDFDVNAFIGRVRELAVELQSAWTARDWERVRPFESEGLFQMHRYWIDAYRRQKLRNVVDDYGIDSIEIVKIDSDSFYEAITVRMRAHGRDYTIDETGRVVGGAQNSMRHWSEYWTFIRTRGADASRKIACPNCGALVAVGATGVCEYCGGRLTSGTFDWVLSRIEQDEAYSG
ncbi:MAG TPA: zinc-ribbon domain-containing transport protein [Thermoanaerobaculia bacterium]|nr:zinc-ribbon domain-containing transport protein [Thermoanaerobaculia bacterium]